jgi:hypothetical protein
LPLLRRDDGDDLDQFPLQFVGTTASATVANARRSSSGILPILLPVSGSARAGC